MSIWISPIPLYGRHVRLEPMTEAHIPALVEIGVGHTFWDFMVYGKMETVDDMRGWVTDILSRAKKGTDLPFVTIHLASGRVAGATRYLNIVPNDGGLEVGGTWYGVEFQRSAVNTECKYLLFKHAFETLGCIRVQLKTDLRSERSQKAIERIGAMKEGVLRNHMILPDGRIRHSVFYSILDTEWEGVKKRLEEMRHLPRQPPVLPLPSGRTFSDQQCRQRSFGAALVEYHWPLLHVFPQRRHHHRCSPQE